METVTAEQIEKLEAAIEVLRNAWNTLCDVVRDVMDVISFLYNKIGEKYKVKPTMRYSLAKRISEQYGMSHYEVYCGLNRCRFARSDC